MNQLFCSHCGEKRGAQYKYCGSCGKSFFNKTKENSNQLYKFIPDDQDIETYNNHVNYLNRVDSRASTISTTLFIGAIICFISVIGTGIGVIGVPLFIIFIITIIVISASGLHYDIAKATIGRKYIYKDHNLKNVYQTLKSVQNSKNELTCVFCGNKRFFRKGIYASSNCTVNCTKCQSYLYTE